MNGGVVITGEVGGVENGWEGLERGGGVERVGG